MPQSFEEFLARYTPELPIWQFLMNLVCAGLMCYVLGRIYIAYGRALSNRRRFARNFMLIGMTTMVVISIVKSSLALSLGLVGALSIVRFRTAIKEPEELAYLFIAIAIGLGAGADQLLITVAAVAVLFGVIWISRRDREEDEDGNLFVTVNSSGDQKLSLSRITETLGRQCRGLSLKRFEDFGDRLEASYLISFDSYDQLEATVGELQSQGDVQVSVVDHGGIL